MRIAEVEIRNFRGLRSFSLRSVAGEPLLVMSGSNGAGKSLVLEAIFIASNVAATGWPGNQAAAIGPWDASAVIRLVLALTGDEQRILDEIAPTSGLVIPGPVPSHIEVRVEVQPRGVSSVADVWTQLLFQIARNAGHTFSVVDYLPADRLIPRGEAPQVAADVLSEQQRQMLRQQAIQSAFVNRQPMTLAGIQPVLATLDYLDLLQQRSGEDEGTEFDILTSAFERATGKSIPRPVLDRGSATGTRIGVRTPAGIEHGLDELSSGEQSVLGLMFYVRRLSSAGGLLLIDEPELHLHPSLQPTLLQALDDVADRAQIWIVTHSTALVTSVSRDALVHVLPPDETGTDQATRVADQDEHVALLEDLGIDAAAALQASLLLIVEGDEDRARLIQLLPIETGRAAFVVAGNGDAVVRTSRALGDGYPGEWVAVRDRDLLSADAVADLVTADEHLFVWPGRMLENELLHPPLLIAALEANGAELSEEEVETKLSEIVDRHRPQILAGRVEHELRRVHSHDAIEGAASIEQLGKYLRAVRATAAAKLDKLSETTESVENEIAAMEPRDRFRLIDGKRAVREIRPMTPFGKPADLVNALLYQARTNTHALPPGLSDLRAPSLPMSRETLMTAELLSPEGENGARDVGHGARWGRWPWSEASRRRAERSGHRARCAGGARPGAGRGSEAAAVHG